MTLVAPGWYLDPSPQNLDGFGQRYWDGNGWTEHLHHPGFGAVVPGKPSTPDGQELSAWWLRVLAQFIDGFIQLPLMALALFPIVASQWDEISAWFNRVTTAERQGTFDSNTFNNLPAIFDPFSGPGLALAGAVLVVNVAYAVIFLRWRQATPGKLIVGLRVRRRESPDLPWSSILPRVGFVAGLGLLTRIPILGLLFSLFGLIDVLWPLWDDKKQALHDKVAHTNVVKP